MNDDSQPRPTPIRLRAAQLAIKVLTAAEKTKTSIRNAFQLIIKQQPKVSNKDVQSAYHLVLEIAKRRGRLEHYLEMAMENVPVFLRDKITTNLILHHLLVFITFLVTEERYQQSSPSNTQIKKLMRVLLRQNDILLSTKEKIALDHIIKRLQLLDLNIIEDEIRTTGIITEYSVKYNFPKWLIEKLLDQHGKKLVQDFLTAENRQIRRYFRLRASHSEIIDEIMNELPDADKNVKKHHLSFPSAGNNDQTHLIMLEVTNFNNQINAVLQKYIPSCGVIQDKASALIPSLLFPIKNEVVIDLTAGPGQKYTLILEHAKNSYIIGCEYNKKRLQIAMMWQKTLKQWLTENGTKAQLLHADSISLPMRNECADKILLDAPCSSTGILAKYPDHRWHQVNLKFITTLQEKLLNEALRILKKGGIGVYSVCSVLKEEGEYLIKKFLNRLELVSFDLNNEWSIPSEFGKRTFRHLHDTDNFFIALFRKNERST